jgi:hypothetical protein
VRIVQKRKSVGEGMTKQFVDASMVLVGKFAMSEDDRGSRLSVVSMQDRE